jgi:hypothetical protein
VKVVPVVKSADVLNMAIEVIAAVLRHMAT